MSIFKKILYILGNFKNKLPFISMLLLFNSILDVVGISFLPIIISFLINDQNNKLIILTYVFEFNFSDLLGVFCAFLIIFFIVKSIISYYIQKKILSYAYSVRISIVSKIINNYNKISFEKLFSKKTSDLILNSITHVGVFTDGVLIPVARSISEIFVLIGLFILLSLQDVKVMLLLLLIVVSIFVLYFLVIRTKLYIYGKIMSLTEGEIIKNLANLIDGFRELKLLNKIIYFTQDIEKNLNKYSESGIKSRSLQLIPRYLFEVSIITFVLVLIYLSLTYNYMSNDKLITLLGFFVIASIRIIPSINLISLSISTVRSSAYAIEKICVDIEEIKENEIQNNNFNNQNKVFSFSRLNFENVTFKYKNSKNFVLKDINFELNFGEIIGIYGKSGSGKSTFIDLLLGLLKPSTGDIEIFSTNDNSINTKYDRVRTWQNQISYLPQKTFLIDDSVYKNITFSNKDQNLNFKQIKYSIDKSLLGNLFENEIDYLSKSIGEKGEFLSGGQRQRLSFARAIYTRRKILVLDEITSSLDKAAEKELFNFIYGLKDEYTIIIVSHNTDMLEKCDKLYEIKHCNVKQIK